MTRKLTLIITLVVLALPAAASAETFCVHSPANCAGTSQANLQAALSAANVNGANTKDTISVGVGLFNDGPAVDVVGNPVDIVGTASNQTAFRSSSTQAGLVILDIQEPASTISKLRVHHSSAAPTATGIVLAGEANNVLVTNQGLVGQFDGIRLVGSAFVDESAVTLAYPNNVQNRAVFVPAGADADIDDSFLEGTVGVSAPGNVEIDRTRIHATQGVVASSGSTVKVRDTEIRVPGPSASNFQAAALSAAGNGTTNLEADRVTAYAGANGAFGLWVVPNASAGNDSSIDMQGSALDGFATDVVASEGGGASATVMATRSAYDLSSTSFSGGVTYTQSGNLNLNGVDPKFLDAASGDLRLRHDSPLIDQGDPAFQPFLGGLDVVKRTRVRDGDGTGGAIVDFGAHEYQRKAPVADAQATPTPAATGQTVSFDASQSSDPDDDPLTYEWSFDDGAGATGAAAQHAFTAPGTHTATVTVTDATGLSASKTVSVDVLAPAAPGPAGGQPGPGEQPGLIAPLRLTGLTLSPTRFRARQPRRPRRARGVAKHRAAIGTTIRFRLSSPAKVTFAVDRALPGRFAGKTCRKPIRANRTRKPCTHWVRVGGFARAGRSGANAQRFDGRLAGRAMRVGRYRLRARAQDGQGRRSAPSAPKRFAIAAS
jgi:hypothetical protein